MSEPRFQYVRSPHSGGSSLLQWLAAIALAGLVAYFTTVGTIQTSLGRIDQREQDHFGQLMQRIDDLGTALRAHLEQDRRDSK